MAVDANNDLVDLFENEKYPISTHISDFMTSTEVIGPVPAEVGALGGAPAPLGRKGRPLNATDNTPQKRPQEKNRRGSGSDSSDSDSDSDSSSGSDRYAFKVLFYYLQVNLHCSFVLITICFICSDGSSSSGSGSRSSYSSKSSGSQGSRNAHKAGMAALKSAFSGEDSSGDEGSKEKDNATTEEEDWQQAFEMMKKKYTPKEEVVVVKTDQKFVKRQNVAHLEVRLLFFSLLNV